MIKWPKAKISLNNGKNMTFHMIQKIQSQNNKFGFDFFQTDDGHIYEYNSGKPIKESSTWKECFQLLEEFGEENFKNYIHKYLSKHGVANDMNEVFSRKEINGFNRKADEYYRSLNLVGD